MTIKYFNSPESLYKMVLLLLEGTRTTLAVFLLTLIFSIPLGFLVAYLRMNRHGAVWRPVSLYIWLMRGTPLMLQVMFLYFFLPTVLPFNLDRFWAVIVAFVLNYAAYFAEIFRGGIQGIPQGQYEAAQVLGFTKGQTFFRIILPQVAKRVLLPVTGEVITLVKDTALAYTVAVSELMRVARTEVSRTASIEPYAVAAMIYLFLNGVASRACQWVEKKLEYYR